MGVKANEDRARLCHGLFQNISKKGASRREPDQRAQFFWANRAILWPSVGPPSQQLV